MKRIVTLLLSCLALTVGRFAQVPLPSGDGPKECVVIDYFSWSREVPPAYVETLRGRVIEGFVTRGREKIVDAAALNAWTPDAGIVSNPNTILNPQRDAAQSHSFAGGPLHPFRHGRRLPLLS